MKRLAWTVALVSGLVLASSALQIRMVFSDDKGATWSPPQIVVPDHHPVGIHDPQTGAPARTGDIIPEPAIDRGSGQLYVAFQDTRFNTFGEDDVLFTTSVASGLTGTWTAPQRVDLPEDRAGFTPGIKVNDPGRFDSTCPPSTDVWAAVGPPSGGARLSSMPRPKGRLVQSLRPPGAILASQQTAAELTLSGGACACR
jgi:hypothetical protein